MVHGVRRRVLGDTSQLGEGLVLRQLIRDDWPMWLVDVGANDGITNSNTWGFVRDGWHSVLVEPNPTVAQKLHRNVAAFANAVVVQKACSSDSGTIELVIYDDDPTGMLTSVDRNGGRVRGDGDNRMSKIVTVQTETLSKIVSDAGVPEDFSLLSIDTEGLDLEVLQSLNPATHRPRIIVTETDELEKVESRKRNLLQERGYRLETIVGVNTIWIHETYANS
jgi:FkbM family methyltransferase